MMAAGSAAGIGVMRLGPSGDARHANAVALTLLGCAGIARLGECWKEVSRAAGLDARPPRESGPTRYVADVSTGGRVRSLRLEIHPVEADAGGGFLALVADRHVPDPMEIELLLASRMRSLGHVYQVVSHDLKAPLNSMQLSLELLADSLADEERAGGRPSGAERHHRHLAILREELGRLNRTLQTVLEEKDPLGAAPRPFDVREVLREIGRLLMPQSRRQRVELDLQLPAMAVSVAGSRERIKQALLNLALHGLGAMQAGGRLGIALEARPLYAAISIQDSSPGVSPEWLEEIYAMLFAPGRGAGPGLRAARMVVESHGGELVARSEPGEGTRFEVQLPLGGSAVSPG